MTTAILPMTGDEAYDLIFPEHFSMLPVTDQKSMQQAMSRSMRVWVGYDDDKLLCTWGLIAPTVLSDRAYLWLWTTEHLKEHVFTLVRHSQREVARMLTHFPIIVGHCQVNAEKSIRWLRWLGAEFGPEINGFTQFEIRAKT